MEGIGYSKANYLQKKDRNEKDFDDRELILMKELFQEALWSDKYAVPLVKLRVRKTDEMSFLVLEGRGKWKGKFHLHYGITDEGMEEKYVHRNLYYGFIRELLAAHINEQIEVVKSKENKP